MVYAKNSSRQDSKMQHLHMFLILCAALFTPAASFIAPNGCSVDVSSARIENAKSTTQLNVLPCPLPALFAGSIAGAVGVGVAFPLDTVKTRAQVMATEQDPIQDYAMVDSKSGTMALPPPTQQQVGNSMAEVAEYILKTEGINGFFGGVQTSMVGQAIIKAVVFAVNAYMLEYFQVSHMFEGNANLQLLTAAATAGFVTSFLAAPVDRIKVLMQAGGGTYEGREDAAFQAVLSTEGWKGLLGRGLFCTMLREVPAYSLYFGVYGALMNWSVMADQLGPAAPIIFGATAGCACWLPIYPIDVVKTFIQNTEGGVGEHGDGLSLIQVASGLYQDHGFGVFWDGLAPRLLRQAVNHATTFALYEVLLNDVFLKI
eukprot:scaffold24757_cov122-Cylindrotheca_fusiformis.AAC.1